MNDETRKSLIDILQAAEEIQIFTHGMDFKAYPRLKRKDVLAVLSCSEICCYQSQYVCYHKGVRAVFRH